MTQSASGYPPPHSEEPQSTPQVAKHEAADVAHTAAQGGRQVGDTVSEQARHVASEAAGQARDLLREGRDQLTDQAKEGQRKAAGSLHTLADQLRDMSEKTDSEGLAPEMARQASERARGVANWLDEREPGALLDEVRAFARRKPGTFLAGAAIAGVLAGRLTRGAVAATKSDSGGEPSTRPAPEPAIRTVPQPAPTQYVAPAPPPPPTVTPSSAGPDVPSPYPGAVNR